MNTVFAKSKIHANQLAKEYFRKEYKLKGNVGLDYMRKGDCGCNKSTFLQYYSKDDPTITQLFEVTICDQCYAKQNIKENLVEHLEEI